MAFVDFNSLLNNHINTSDKIILKKKEIKNENNVCHAYKKLEHYKYKKNRLKEMDCDIISNFQELEEKSISSSILPKHWNKLDSFLQNKLINNYINSIVENNKIEYDIVKKKVDLALLSGKKIVYDSENSLIHGIKNLEF